MSGWQYIVIGGSSSKVCEIFRMDVIAVRKMRKIQIKSVQVSTNEFQGFMKRMPGGSLIGF